jgi:hypothetical protein
MQTAGQRRRGWPNAVFVTSTVVILGFTVAFWIYGFLGPPEWRIGYPDLTVYTDATRRLFGGGSWYLERQLHGPYEITQGDVLYPPVTAWFFAPWLALPDWTFSAVPVAVTAWVVGRFRPAPWTWPLLALCVAWPMVPLKTLRLNPDVWLMAAVATGLVYRWPGAFVLVKPSMLPFAMIGMRSRGWWAVVGLLLAGSLPFLAQTLMYPQVILDTRGGGLLYSIPDVPFLLIPVIAWLGSPARHPSADTPGLSAGSVIGSPGRGTGPSAGP